MEDENNKCPICKSDDIKYWTRDRGGRLDIECPCCGNFAITRTAMRITERANLSHKISAWIRDKTENKSDIPEINSNTIKEIESILPIYGVGEKQIVLLRAIERRTEFPGQTVLLVKHFDYPLAWAKGEDEFRYLLTSLIERGYVKRIDGPSDLKDNFVFDIQITPSGWEYLDLQRQKIQATNQAFVAMSFSEEMKTAYFEGIAPAVEKAGYKPYRVDSMPHIDRIDSKIIAEIKNSKFLIADATQQKAGVYFEAGFALGLGIPVFWSVRDDDKENLHFDTRQYNHIIWKNNEELKEKLYYYIKALI